MLKWKSPLLVNKTFRETILEYKIEKIAFINLVKCQPRRAGSSVFKTMKEETVYECWDRFTRAQIDLLNPDFIAFQWKDTMVDYSRLRLRDTGIQFYAYNGTHLKSKRVTRENEEFVRHFKEFYSKLP
jgi:hypothetical protein